MRSTPVLLVAILTVIGAAALVSARSAETAETTEIAEKTAHNSQRIARKAAVQELNQLRQSRRADLEDLYDKLAAAPDAQAALQVQRRIERHKFETEILYLEMQLRFAPKESSEKRRQAEEIVRVGRARLASQ